MKFDQKYLFSIQSWTPYSTRETSEALQENKSIVIQWLQTDENTKTTDKIDISYLLAFNSCISR